MEIHLTKDKSIAVKNWDLKKKINVSIYTTQQNFSINFVVIKH